MFDRVTRFYQKKVSDPLAQDGKSIGEPFTRESGKHEDSSGHRVINIICSRRIHTQALAIKPRLGTIGATPDPCLKEIQSALPGLSAAAGCAVTPISSGFWKSPLALQPSQVVCRTTFVFSRSLLETYRIQEPPLLLTNPISARPWHSRIIGQSFAIKPIRKQAFMRSGFARWQGRCSGPATHRARTIKKNVTTSGIFFV